MKCWIIAHLDKNNTLFSQTKKYTIDTSDKHCVFFHKKDCEHWLEIMDDDQTDCKVVECNLTFTE